MERIQSQRYLWLAGAVLLSGFFKFEVALFSLLCSIVVISFQFLFQTKQHDSLTEKNKVNGMGKAKFFMSVGLLVLILVFALSFLFEKDFFNLAIDMVLGSYQVWGNPFPSLSPFFVL